MNDMRDKYADRLPIIRIQKAVIHHFKSVEYGEITFNCGKQFIPYGTQSDILGIYGQNGSGKTSFIEALSVLRALLLGIRVPNIYAECIAKDSEMARMEFTFDMQYPNGDVRKAVYDFCMETEEIDESEGGHRYESKYENESRMETAETQKNKYRMRIFNEVLSIGGDIGGKKIKLQPVIDTSTEDSPFGPTSKRNGFIGSDNKAFINLEVNKRLASVRSQSFIFMKETVEVFHKCGLHSPYYQMILELHYFSEFYFHVIDTKSSGYIRFNFGLPLYTQMGNITLNANRPTTVAEGLYKDLCKIFDQINTVITQLVPGLTVGIKTLSPTLMKNGTKGEIIELIAKRDGIELPLRDESDGIRKIISVLSLIITAYNEQSVTIAIDEFDAGIYEYLLGEILQTFEESGKGQFIFTSHNLRPLEVIDKKFLYFTTTNPKNRYIQMKYVGKTNNLRSLYYREILLGEQDEEIYNRTKKHKIVAALKKAGAEE